MRGLDELAFRGQAQHRGLGGFAVGFLALAKCGGRHRGFFGGDLCGSGGGSLDLHAASRGGGGLAFGLRALRIELRLQDYRDVAGRYDRIVSIEMLEAVGERFWPVYFDTLRQRLEDDGTAVLQVITMADAFFDRYRERIRQRCQILEPLLDQSNQIYRLRIDFEVASIHPGQKQQVIDHTG